MHDINVSIMKNNIMWCIIANLLIHCSPLFHYRQWKKKLLVIEYLIFIRRVAEVFGRVFVLTGIFIKGVIKYEPLGGSGGMPPPQNILKSRGPGMLFSALCTSIFQTRWSVK